MRPEKKPSAMPPARGEAIDQYRTVRTRNIGRTSASVAGMGRTVRSNAKSAVRNIAPRASWFTAASALALRRGHALNGWAVAWHAQPRQESGRRWSASARWDPEQREPAWARWDPEMCGLGLARSSGMRGLAAAAGATVAA